MEEAALVVAESPQPLGVDVVRDQRVTAAHRRSGGVASIGVGIGIGIGEHGESSETHSDRPPFGLGDHLAHLLGTRVHAESRQHGRHPNSVERQVLGPDVDDI
ncbi:MAG TPA: hypothetical protein PKE05_10185 [Microthrixaceae bacterium]|nr:hypothetical protein [Microthrixaceae bacterium]